MFSLFCRREGPRSRRRQGQVRVKFLLLTCRQLSACCVFMWFITLVVGKGRQWEGRRGRKKGKEGEEERSEFWNGTVQSVAPILSFSATL